MAPTPVNIDLINLNRLVERLQQNILQSEPSTEYRLRTSSHQRVKTGANVDFAKKLLVKVENDTLNIRVPSKQQETQARLLKNRHILDEVTQKLKDLSDTALEPETDSELEDLLNSTTPSHSDSTEDREPTQKSPSLWENLQTETISPSPILTPPEAIVQSSERAQLLPSTLRSRTTTAKPTQPPDTAHTTSTSLSPSVPISNTLHETLLSHNRTEQEDLTTQMLTLAQALKASSKAISAALDADAVVVDQAVGTIEKSTGMLEAAQKSMGYLVKMSEGTGWWGRIMLYFWIAGLAFLAFTLVVFMPKLRF